MDAGTGPCPYWCHPRKPRGTMSCRFSTVHRVGTPAPPGNPRGVRVPWRRGSRGRRTPQCALPPGGWPAHVPAPDVVRELVARALREPHGATLRSVPGRRTARPAPGLIHKEFDGLAEGEAMRLAWPTRQRRAPRALAVGRVGSRTVLAMEEIEGRGAPEALRPASAGALARALERSWVASMGPGSSIVTLRRARARPRTGARTSTAGSGDPCGPAAGPRRTSRPSSTASRARSDPALAGSLGARTGGSSRSPRAQVRPARSVRQRRSAWSVTGRGTPSRIVRVIWRSSCPLGTPPGRSALAVEAACAARGVTVLAAPDRAERPGLDPSLGEVGPFPGASSRAAQHLPRTRSSCNRRARRASGSPGAGASRRRPRPGRMRTAPDRRPGAEHPGRTPARRPARGAVRGRGGPPGPRRARRGWAFLQSLGPRLGSSPAGGRRVRGIASGCCRAWPAAPRAAAQLARGRRDAAPVVCPREEPRGAPDRGGPRALVEVLGPARGGCHSAPTGCWPRSPGATTGPCSSMGRRARPGRSDGPGST